MILESYHINFYDALIPDNKKCVTNLCCTYLGRNNNVSNWLLTNIIEWLVINETLAKTADMNMRSFHLGQILRPDLKTADVLRHIKLKDI